MPGRPCTLLGRDICMLRRDRSQYLIMQRIDRLEYSFPEGFDADAEDLVRQLLVDMPSHRLGARSVDDIKAHRFFQGVQRCVRSCRCAGMHAEVRAACTRGGKRRSGAP
jgi:hypothetical protein